MSLLLYLYMAFSLVPWTLVKPLLEVRGRRKGSKQKTVRKGPFGLGCSGDRTGHCMIFHCEDSVKCSG